MSEDYYIICERKKLYMPLFTMGLAGCGLVSKNHVFDFILKVEGEELKLVSEHVLYEMTPDDQTLDEAGWIMVNSWLRHEFDKESTKSNVENSKND